MASLGADELELLWTRIELEVALSPTRVQGVSRLWVVAPREAASVRLHCRQCSVVRVAVNGEECEWELLDPHELILRDEALDGEAFDVHQRAAFMAAAEGELEVRLPSGHLPQGQCRYPSEFWAQTPDGARAALSRSQAHESVRSRTLPAPMLIEVTYSLSEPRGGFRDVVAEEPVLYTSGGGAAGNALGVDYDGARCRWPCLDGPSAGHLAPVELVVHTDTRHALIASGQLVSCGVGGTRAPLQTWEWFVGPHAPIRGVGFALGGIRPVPGAPPIRQWTMCDGDLAAAAHSALGLDAAALFFGDVLGTGAFPEPGHAQVKLETKTDRCASRVIPFCHASAGLGSSQPSGGAARRCSRFCKSHSGFGAFASLSTGRLLAL